MNAPNRVAARGGWASVPAIRPPWRPARRVGVAWAPIGIVRAVPFHASRRRLYLPETLMAEGGVDVACLFERGSVPGLLRGRGSGDGRRQ